MRPGSVMERGLPLVVEGVNRGLVLQKNIHNNILSIITGHMKRSATTGIHSLNLTRMREGWNWIGNP